MTSVASKKGAMSSSASASRVVDDHHESMFHHFTDDISSGIKKLKGAFHHQSSTRVAPLPPDKTPTSQIDKPKENFITRNIHSMESRLKDIKNDFTGGQKLNAVTDTLLLPTHMMEDDVYKPLATKAAHAVESAAPVILHATVGPLVLGGVVVIAAAIFIFASYKEVNHVIDKAIS